MSSELTFIPHRAAGNPAAIVFIHGFAGKPEKTWGDFPAILKENAKLSDWDIYSFGYDTRLLPDIVGVWSADAPIGTLANLLETASGIPPMDRYRTMAILAHSMGGLVVQRALVDDRLADRISHVVVFGTPSAGLVKASLFSFWKRQLRDMAANSEFIRDLREKWNDRFGKGMPFAFRTLAGENDEFVPRTSSLDPFPQSTREVIHGDHREIVKPQSADSPNVRFVVKTLLGEAPSTGAASGALLALEQRDFHKAIRILEPIVDELDEDGLVRLALALEGVGRPDKAIAMLQKIRNKKFSDALGVLAGRLKRRWYVERRRKDVETSYALYKKAYTISIEKRDAQQAFYHGINLAYLDIAFKHNIPAAKRRAKVVLEHCRKASTKNHWLYATIGDANLILGRPDLAMEHYRRALTGKPSPREIESIFQQASRLADLLGNPDATAEIVRLFEAE